MYKYRCGEKDYLVKYYSAISGRELAYEYIQPDCPNCQKFLEDGGCLPKWCHECHTIREDDSPLCVELSSRQVDVWSYYPQLQT